MPGGRDAARRVFRAASTSASGTPETDVSFVGAHTWSELAGPALALPLLLSAVQPARSPTPARKVRAERREVEEPVFIGAVMPECDCQCDGEYKAKCGPTRLRASLVSTLPARIFHRYTRIGCSTKPAPDPTAPQPAATCPICATSSNPRSATPTQSSESSAAVG